MQTIYIILADNGKGANAKVMGAFKDLHQARTRIHCLQAEKQYKKTRFQIVQEKLF